MTKSSKLVKIFRIRTRTAMPGCQPQVLPVDGGDRSDQCDTLRGPGSLAIAFEKKNGKKNFVTSALGVFLPCEIFYVSEVKLFKSLSRKTL
jgi:hypothetical protein